MIVRGECSEGKGGFLLLKTFLDNCLEEFLSDHVVKTSVEVVEVECYDPPNFSHLPYPSLDTPQVISYDLKPVTKPPVIFPSASPPELMGKTPLPLNPSSLSPLEDLPPRTKGIRPATPEQTIPTIPQWTSPSQVVMTRSPSPAMSIYPDFNLPPVQPPTPIPWSTHR